MNYKKTIKVLKEILSTDPIYSDNIYLVGGCVRDLILGIEPKDIDLCIDIPDGIRRFSLWLKSNFPNQVSGFCEFPRYGTMKFNLHVDTNEISEIECVLPRLETYNSGPRKPDVVIQTSIKEDSKRRDFCCNALYQRVSNDELIDPTGQGYSDCINKILNTPVEARQTFIDDPLRMLRAVRFCCTKGFEIHPDTLSYLYPYRQYDSISKERLRDEFEKIITSNNAVKGINLLHDSGLLKRIFPELVEAWDFDQCSKYHSLNLRDHLFSVLEKTSNDPRLRWAALLHDISKYKIYTFDGSHRHFKFHECHSETMAEKVLVRLKYDNDFISDVKSLVKNHMRFKQQYDYKTQKFTGKDKQIRKFISQMGNLVELELELIDADNLSHDPKYNMPGQVDDLRDRINQILSETTTDLNSVVSGKDIMDFLMVGPSKLIGEVKLIFQDYLDENPYLGKEDLFNRYMEEFANHFIKLEPLHWCEDEVSAKLEGDSVGLTIKIKDYFPDNSYSPKVSALFLPSLYRRLSRDHSVREIISKMTGFTELEMMEGFKSLKLSLKSHDLVAEITWDDGTETVIM